MSIYLIRQFCSALFVTDKCAGEQTAKLGLEVVHAHTKDAHPEARLRLGQASLSHQAPVAAIQERVDIQTQIKSAHHIND